MRCAGVALCTLPSAILALWLQSATPALRIRFGTLRQWCLSFSPGFFTPFWRPTAGDYESILSWLSIFKFFFRQLFLSIIIFISSRLFILTTSLSNKIRFFDKNESNFRRWRVSLSKKTCFFDKNRSNFRRSSVVIMKKIEAGRKSR